MYSRDGFDAPKDIGYDADGTKVAYAGDYYEIQIITGVATSYYFGSQPIKRRLHAGREAYGAHIG